MKNVLVFPCGSELALDIHRCVKYSTYFHLVGLSSCEDNGRFVYDDYMDGAPFVDDGSFAGFLKGVVESRKIDAIYPATDAALFRIKELEDDLGIKVISSPLETVRTCYSKRETYKRLAGAVRIPKIFEPNEVVGFPVFAKPDVGHSSIGTEKICDKYQLECFVEKNDNRILMEYLPGDEYTIDCFTDKDGRLLFCKARIRKAIKMGISGNTEYVSGKEFEDFVERINKALGFRGAWFVQVKRDSEGELCLMEVASRFGGSSHLSMALGVNLPLLSLFDAFDYGTEIICNDVNPVMNRALNSVYRSDISYSHVYVDYDDCLILQGKDVNYELVGFLYKCRNEKKQIYLLSRHRGDLHSEIMDSRLEGIFDGIIHIDENDEKWKYISNKDSILIDDSFAERKSVHDKLGISVFGPEMVVTLL